MSSLNLLSLQSLKSFTPTAPQCKTPLACAASVVASQGRTDTVVCMQPALDGAQQSQVFASSLWLWQWC